MEHSILQYVTLMLNVYQVCYCVSRCVKMGLVLIKYRSESQWRVLLGYLTISPNVRYY